MGVVSLIYRFSEHVSNSSYKADNSSEYGINRFQSDESAFILLFSEVLRHSVDCDIVCRFPISLVKHLLFDSIEEP